MPKTGARGGTGTRGGGSRGGKRGGDGASIGDSKAKGGLRGQRGGKGRPALNTDGYPPQKGGAETESDILGGFTYYCEADGKTYHGQEAMDKYEEDHPGEGGPHDGITGESGMYWGDSSFHPSGGQQDQQSGWAR
jgi:hypothetical protein